MRDDLGTEFRTTGPVRRVVSLVPSLTESIAVSDPGLLVGATDWCTHPAGLDVVRVKGTKNPDVALVVSLAPDLVVANAEENRAPDIAALRASGVPVWVTDIRDVPGAITSLARMLAACGIDRPPWLDDASEAWRRPLDATTRHRAVVPIWRRPWMALGRGTFAGDVLARCGVDNALADAAERYPRTTPTDLAALRPDLVVLPDEPYRFTATDGPEAFPDLPCALVDGRLLTWYGPSLVAARESLTAALRPARWITAASG